MSLYNNNEDQFQQQYESQSLNQHQPNNQQQQLIFQHILNLQQKDTYFQSFYVLQHRFDIPKYYQVQVPIGAGGYGVVIKAIDKRTNQTVAIKKILRPFLNSLETKRILREICILTNLRHDNIVQMTDIFNPMPLSQFNEIYLVYKYMEADLHQIIISEQELSNKHIQYFMYQLFLGLHYMHTAKVLHRDLKPSNLLVNKNCDIKICDFGLARTIKYNQNNLNIMTEYVATRWYRAPELLLHWKEYTTAVDLWSAGCIFAELINRAPLIPGDSYLNQLTKTLELVGNPTEEDLINIISTRARDFVRTQNYSSDNKLDNIVKTDNKDAIDLIKKLLVFNPAKRITAKQALQHPYFKSIRNENLEIAADVYFNFTFEDAFNNLDEFVQNMKLKQLVHNEMKKFHPYFQEFNSQSYFQPVIRDDELLTLDIDGSFIYIDYSKLNQINCQQQQPYLQMANLQQYQQNETLQFLGYQQEQVQQMMKLQQQQKNEMEQEK